MGITLICNNNTNRKTNQLKPSLVSAKQNIITMTFSTIKAAFKKTWKTITETVPNTKNISITSNFDNVLDKANEFNSYFANVGKNSYTKTQELIHCENVQYSICENVASGMSGEDSTFRPQPAHTDTVILMIKDINETSSVGSDGIPKKFTKDALSIIASYIT